MDAIGSLPEGGKRLKGDEGFSLRVGDWRVLFDMDAAARIITVVAVRPRGDAYKKRWTNWRPRATRSEPGRRPG